MHASGVCCGRGDVSSGADVSPIPLGLHNESKDDVLASLLPSALSPVCRSLCPTVPIPVLAVFPVCPGRAVASGPCRQAPGSLASCQGGCLPGASPRSGLPGGQGGVALLSDSLVTRGSPLAQHAEVRRFSRGAGAWVSSRHSRGIASQGFEWHRSCWKPSSLLDRGSRDRAGELLPREPGFAAHLSVQAGPLLPFPAPSQARSRPQEQSCAGRGGGAQPCLSQPPLGSIFSPSNFIPLWPSLAALRRAEGKHLFIRVVSLNKALGASAGLAVLAIP